MTESVSRETPPAPAAASGVFASRLTVAERYAGWLVDVGVDRGVIGPREVPRLWERHLLNCALLSRAVPAEVTVADIGSGAGLPGVVLGLLRPDLQITLVEPLQRRCTFLEEVLADLELDHVRVLRSRAEELHGRRTFEIVTARAVAPVERLARWCLPLVEPGGALVAMKGQAVHEELDRARPVLQRLGAGAVSVTEETAPGVETPTTVLRVERGRGHQIGSSAGPPGRSSARRRGKGR